MSQAISVAGGAPARTRVYLRLLYSARFGARVRRALERRRSFTTEDLQFVRSVDFQHLAAEQKARVRNLSFSLRKSCPFLAQLLSESEFRELVAAYADSQLFWQAWGRSLAENFCLFAYRKLLSAGCNREAEVARLDGVSSGVAASASGAASPWAMRFGLPHECGAGFESYRSSGRLLSEAGALKPTTGEQEPHLVRISLEGNQLRTEIEPC